MAGDDDRAVGPDPAEEGEQGERAPDLRTLLSPALSEGSFALNPLPTAEVGHLLLNLVQAALPDDVVVTTRSEIEAIKLRAYTNGWQDSVHDLAASGPPDPDLPDASGGPAPDRPGDNATIFPFPQPLPLVPAAEVVRQRPLMPHRRRRHPKPPAQGSS